MSERQQIEQLIAKWRRSPVTRHMGQCADELEAILSSWGAAPSTETTDQALLGNTASGAPGAPPSTPDGFLRSMESGLAAALTYLDGHTFACNGGEDGPCDCGHVEPRDVLNAMLEDVCQRQLSTPSGWLPIETAPKGDTMILRPHRIWGAMDVRRITEADAERVSVLAEGIPWAWLNGDYTTAWTDSAFLPFWMPLPSPPGPSAPGSET